ncbi:MAG: C10 family peptidase [Bacteroidetes bacterium]|nr:C10 family peptidase [Bacteroidota bacterium]
MSACLLVCLSACRKQQGIQKRNLKVSEPVISIDLATKIASRINLQKYFEKVPLQKRSYDSLFFNSIISSYTVNDTNNLPAFHVFNFGDEKGWLILSADVRMQPILAYNTSGSFETSDDIPSGLGDWLDITIGLIEGLRDSTVNADSMGIWSWQHLLSNTYLPSEVQTLLPDDIESYSSLPPCGSNTVSTGPLLPCQWGQWCSYNSNSPTCSTAACGFMPTGCVATATAQIMKYWGQPSTLWNFSAMPNNNGNAGVAYLMKDIGNELNMNWSCSESSAFTEDAASVLKNYYNYSSANYVNYSRSAMLTDIWNGKPGILRSCRSQTVQKKKWWQFWKVKYKTENCHAWCYDGNQYIDKCGKRLNETVHMNWGWHEVDFIAGQWVSSNRDFNGFYNISNWTIDNPEQWNYQYANGMVKNIAW